MSRPFLDVEIVLRGRLDSAWREHFAPLHLTFDDGATRISGSLADQSAVHGVMCRLRDSGIELDSLEIRRRTAKVAR